MTHGLDAIGPVDVAVIGFEGSHFNGEIVPALKEIQENGTVRVLDITFVRKDPDGAAEVVELTDPEVAKAFGQMTDAQFDLLSDEDLRSIADGLAADSSAAVVVWENCWAARLGAAVRASNGEVLMLERVPRDTVEAAVSALDAG
ncbi:MULTISPECIES: DUF6325 family protein [unclassified Streptomyces]|uniref:DUF6325 family protein n=1 Tax=unclassified Streptomyces TaxID=2593676 RepID=UPI0003A084B1|nr:DUF6325 family protein [Streptomyces sp. HmicA12]